MKIIFINWRWNIREPQVSIENSNKVIVTAFTRTQSSEYNQYINNILQENSGASSLVLVHADDNNAWCFIKNDIRIPESYNYKVVEFCNRNERNTKAYDLFSQGDVDNPNIHLEKFVDVWDYFWGEDLRLLLGKFIKTFLPLAIDLQGLSKCLTEKTNANNYLTEVINDLPDNTINEWNIIKKTLALKQNSSDNPEESLPEEYRFDDFEKTSMYFPLESVHRPGFSIEDLREYLKNNDNYELIVKWFKEIVQKLNAKLAP
jgi:hypothetical protein